MNPLLRTASHFDERLGGLLLLVSGLCLLVDGAGLFSVTGGGLLARIDAATVAWLLGPPGWLLLCFPGRRWA